MADKNVKVTGGIDGGLLRSFAQYEKQLKGVISTTSEYNKAAKEFTGTITRLVSATEAEVRQYGVKDSRLKMLKKSVVDLANAQKTQTATVQQSARAMTQQAQQLQKVTAATNMATTSARGFHMTWRGIMRLVSIQIVYRNFFLLSSAIRQAADDATDLYIKIAEVQTINTARDSFDRWARVIRELSDAFNLTLLDQTEAAYQALSNQVVDSAAQFRSFGKTINEFATAAVTTAEASTNLLTGAINAFHLSVYDADRVAGVFFKTIEQGRVRAEEMNKTIGSIAILAGQLGVELEELGGLISTLTIQGVKYNEAATQLRGIFIKLLKPTEEMKDFYAELGVASGEAAIQAYGLEGVLGRLLERTKGSSTEWAKYINRIRGISGALAISSDGFSRLRENIELLKNPMADYGRAINLVLENTGKQLKISIEQIKNFFIQDVVGQFLAGLGDLTNGFEGFVGIVEKAVYILKVSLATIALTAVTAAFTGAAKAIYSFTLNLRTATTAAMFFAEFNPWFLVGTAAAVASIGIIKIIDNIGKAREEMEEAFNEWVDGYEIMVEKQREMLHHAAADVERYADGMVKALAYAAAVIQSENYSIIGTEADKLEEFEDFIKASNDAILEYMDSITEAAVDKWETAVKELTALMEALRGYTLSSEDKQFQLDLEKYSKPEQAKRIQEFINQLKVEMEAGALAGMSEADLQVYIKRIEKYFDMRVKILQDWRKDFENEAKKLQDSLAKDLKKIDAEMAKIYESAAKRGYATHEEKVKYHTLGRRRKGIVGQQERDDANLANLHKQYSILSDFAKQYAQTREQITAVLETSIAYQEIEATLLQHEMEMRQIEQEALVKATSALEDFNAERLTEAQTLDELITAYNEYIDLINKLQIAQYSAGQSPDLSLSGRFDETFNSKATEIALQQFQKDVKTQHDEVKAALSEAQNTYEQEQESLKAIMVASEKVAGELELFRNQGYAIAGTERTELALETLANLLSTPANINSQEELVQAVRELSAAYTEQSKGEYDYRPYDIYKLQSESNKLIQQVLSIARAIGAEGEGGVKGIADRMFELETQIAQSKETMSQLETQIVATVRDEFGENVFNFGTYVETLGEAVSSFESTVHAMEGFLKREGKATGGPIGVDTIPLMGAPGEFMVNRHATDNFYSQLVAMNSGRSPGYSDGGGMLDVGGITVNVNEAHTPGMTASEVLHKIQRGVRHGTLNLRR